MSDRNLPRGACFKQPASKQFGQQPAADERRFTASGTSHNGNKAVVPKSLQQFDCLFFATKEQVVFFLGKRPQTREWIHLGGCGGHTHTSFKCKERRGTGTNSRQLNSVMICL